MTDAPARDRYSPARFRPLTFHDATPAFASGADSPRDYLERCLDTIAAREPVVQAWVSLNEAGAREAADASTARWRAGAPLSPIDGMPIGIKDLIETRDMPTRMGSPLFRDNHPKRDSALVQALRQAGAVVLGKTVTTELGMSHPGPTTNPFDPARTPGGSSSGSGAAVGARMVPAAIGTQVVGSVIRPASFCGNWALKPTQGALNRGERQGLSHSTVGVHAGAAEDMWLVAAEIAKRAGGDPGCPGLYGPAAPPEARKPARLAVLHGEGWPRTDAPTKAAFGRVLAALEAAGVALLRPGEDKGLDALEEALAESMALSNAMCAFEMRWTVENLVALHPEGVSDSLKARLALGRSMTTDDYRDLLRRRTEARARLAAVAPIVEGFVAPAACGPAPLLGGTAGSQGEILHTTGDPSYNAMSSILGAPVVTVPLMAVGALPVGVQVMGQPHEDAAVAATARWLAEAIPPVEG
jgi:Asp-tRNA(Asn)/Glu-tRNA(Gln) amidotransferase A subunit family amidase